MSIEKAAGPIELAHMLMKVSDIERSERFYVDVLGFQKRNAKPLADGRPFVPFLQGIALTNGGTKDSPQIDHMAFKVDDVRAIAKRLHEANVKFDRDLHDGIYGLTVYFFDPDGTMIEFYQENAKLAG